VLTDLSGRIVLSTYEPYGLNYPHPGWVEQDPDQIWHACALTTRRVIEGAGVDPREILGVGVSAQMFNLLPVDEACRPLMPMLSWLDTRSTRQADRLWEGETPRMLFDHTGNIPTAKDIIPKILWLKEERPELWTNTYKLLDCKEFLLWKLTGRIVTDWHGASVFFLFDPHSKEWSSEACDRLGIPMERLPEARPCTDLVGQITAKAAKETGLASGTPVVACAGDVAVAQTGSGANAAGKAHLCIGTATWVGVSSERFVNNPERPFWGLNHIDPSKWIIAGEMETGGGALMWLRDLFGHEEVEQAHAQGISAYEMMSRMAEGVEPGSNRLLFAPWLSGERAPVLDHYARGAFVGLSMGHTKGHLIRAVMEGVAYQIRWICQALEEIGLTIDQVNAIGGGSTSSTWTQIISDIVRRELHIVANPLEAGAVGAALTVAVGMGVYPDVESLDERIVIERVVVPRLENASRYEALYAQYRDLYRGLSPIFRRLHDVP
jgi:xylulokinase